MFRFTLFFLGLLPFQLWAQNTIEQDSLKTAIYHTKVEQNVHTAPNIAKAYLDSLKFITETTSYKMAPYLYHRSLANYQFIVHDMEASVSNYQRALSIAEKEGWTKEALGCKTWLGNHKYFQNKEEEARTIFTEVLAEAEPLGMVDEASSALFGLASLESDDERTLQFLLKIDSLHQKDGLVTANLSNAYGSIGNIYLRTFGSREIAKSYYEKSLEAAIQSNYTAGVNHITVLLGDMALKDGNYDEAYAYFEADLKQNQDKGDLLNAGHSILGLASVDMATGKLDIAESRLKEALAIYENHTDSVSMTNTHLALAELYLELENSVKAKEHIDYAAAFPNVLSNTNYDIKLLEATIGYLRVQGDYKGAFRKQKELEQLKEKQLEEKNSEAFLEMEQKYRASQKEQELELLRSEQALAEARSRNQRLVLILGLVLAVLVGLFFYFQYRNRKKTNDKLRQLDVAKSTFFENISHEFRTPITLIKGPVEDQLNQPDLQATDRKKLLTAQRNTLRLETLVDQLLALSKLESGHLKLQVRPGNISNFIKVQAEAFQFATQEKNIDFELMLEPSANKDWFDHDAVEKILFNLLGNAVKYTPENGSVWVTGVSENGTYTFRVKNSGSFIKPADRAKIFERFYQTNDNNTGTGIGLALTHELTELHHGEISVESTEQGYTSFNVELPMEKQAFAESEILSETVQTVFSTDQPLGDGASEVLVAPDDDAPVLLMVDDNAEIVSYVHSVFSESFQIKTASNGKVGFKLALDYVPDIIISDVMMPVEDGFELTRKVKEEEITSHIPVLLLTAKAEEQDRLTGLDTGADAYLTKPFSTQVLKATVLNLLENRSKIQERFAREIILKPKEVSFTSADERFLERLEKVMDEHLVSSSFSAAKFSQEMGVSRMQLHRKLKALTGLSTSEFLRSQRLKLAARLLKKDKISIAEAGYSVGFNDPSYFTKCFKSEFGCSPSEYIK